MVHHALVYQERSAELFGPKVPSPSRKDLLCSGVTASSVEPVLDLGIGVGMYTHLILGFGLMCGCDLEGMGGACSSFLLQPTQLPPPSLTKSVSDSMGGEESPTMS